MILLLDIGNSRLKWAQQNNDVIGSSQTLCHHQALFYDQLKTDWKPLTRPEIIAIASVSSEKIKAGILNIVRALWGDIKVICAVSTSEDFGVKNGYLHPQKLGVDRWLGLIAAYQAYQHSLWVIDCGTAITMDFVNEAGIHKGGVISAGLHLMKTALSNNTHDLALFNNEYPLALAQQTDKAIFSGTLYAVIGLIKCLLSDYPSHSVLILTGGDANKIADHLPQPVIIESDLVLQGLALFIQKYL
ncbi:MAG: type III pantothenate kinase [Methylococcales bacterium]|nr:type III pantothenate kinase [Methylococcales bacterium]